MYLLPRVGHCRPVNKRKLCVRVFQPLHDCYAVQNHNLLQSSVDLSTTDFVKHFIDVQLNYFVRLAFDLLAECKKTYKMIHIVKIKTTLIVKEKSRSQLLKR